MKAQNKKKTPNRSRKSSESVISDKDLKKTRGGININALPGSNQ